MDGIVSAGITVARGVGGGVAPLPVGTRAHGWHAGCGVVWAGGVVWARRVPVLEQGVKDGDTGLRRAKRYLDQQRRSSPLTCCVHSVRASRIVHAGRGSATAGQPGGTQQAPCDHSTIRRKKAQLDRRVPRRQPQTRPYKRCSGGQHSCRCTCGDGVEEKHVAQRQCGRSTIVSRHCPRNQTAGGWGEGEKWRGGKIAV